MLNWYLCQGKKEKILSIFPIFTAMKKTISVLLVIGALLSVAFTSFDDPKYKNLKILPKDISHKAMDSIMHNYSSAMGVKCEFCHVRNKETNKMDMASDAKPEKLIARKMMTMTAEINKKYFPPEEGTTPPPIPAITCFTCHRGEAMPNDVQPKHEEKKKDSVANRWGPKK